MAHWAELDNNNIVLRVTVGNNNDPNGDEGYQWLIDNLGGNWVKTSYNGAIRGRFAAIGDIYDEKLDAFITPQPFASWTLNTDTYLWEAPLSYPEDGFLYEWNESTKSWDIVEFPTDKE